jgi:ubiquitin carboxyl-terminal hydrolase 8
MYSSNNNNNNTMNNEQYIDKGLSGLANLGNTCFINALMQVISHTYELNNFLEDGKYKKKLQNKCDSAILLEWDNLRKIMWNSNCVISPGKYIKTIQKVAKIKGLELFTGYSQNDVQEFLLFLIDCFHTSLSREIKMTISGKTQNETDKVAVKCFEMIKNMYSKEYSEIWNLFYAVHVSEITDFSSGKQLQITPEPYFMIDLPIPLANKSPSLIDCLNHYVEGEVLEGENAWYNEKTKEKVNVKKKIQFWSFPNILAIDFKRFNNRSQKNQVLVTFPLENLDLSEYVIGYKSESYKYDLYGVCNHTGGVMGGHYTSYVKNANGKWYHFNDTIVSEVGIPQVIISPKAYVLFYRKRPI